MKELYLAGQLDLLEELFLQIKGVESVTRGLVEADNGLKARCIRLEYNPKKLDICGILREYYNVVDPFAQAEDELEQPAVIYSSSEDIPQIEYYARFMQNRGGEPQATCGNLILNDSITPGKELRRMQVRYGRFAGFVGE